MPIVNSFSNGSARAFGWTSGGAAFELTWSPEPAGSPFTTGIYSGVDFTASATVTIVGGGKDIEYALVAGGGGGSSQNSFAGAGGGAGGVLPGTIPSIASGTYTVTVGGGGTTGTSGNPSVFGPVSSTGGGSGGPSYSVTGTPGGSGGGAMCPLSVNVTNPGGTGIPGQGNNGGGSILTVAPNPQGGFPRDGGGGGGGGASAVGSNGSYNPSVGPTGGTGGNGTTITLTGTPIAVGGGGGGGGIQSSTIAGGSGGGGLGAGNSPTLASTAGTTNTGGGGGGGDRNAIHPGKAGGSGRVIIRWET